MKSVFVLFLSLISVVAKAQTSYSDSIQTYRQQHDSLFFAEVLNETERQQVQEICYFPVDTNYRITATFQVKKGKKFVMPMSKERVVYYQRYALLSFELQDTIVTVELYENKTALAKTKKKERYLHGVELFLPFRDLTNGTDSYGGGRYLEVLLPAHQSEGKITLDFNATYHPYCAYSDRYSCPIVPMINKMPVFIRAGECYHLHHE